MELLRSGADCGDLDSILQSGSDDQWRAPLEQTAPVQLGAEIVLSAGSGSKRKWNGSPV